MFAKLYPSACAQSAYEIDYQRLYERGYRGLLFDIDNTLVPHGADPTPQAEDLLRKLKGMGFRVMLLSDNGRSRVRHFIKSVHVPYIYGASKPSPRPFVKSVQMLGLKREEVVVVGDQIFTDILGANRAGLHTILVNYIGYDKPGWKGFRRIAERIILSFYRHSHRYKTGLPHVKRNNP